MDLPLTDEVISKLRMGDMCELTGDVFTARDAAHKRMVEALEAGEGLPFDIKGQVIYYVGPTPAKPGAVVGSAGPTTAGRMDAYTPRLIDLGLKGSIGKGARSQPVIDAMVRNKAVYFIAVGGAGALLAKRIKKVEMVAYEELGTEAIRKFRVERFPVVVVNDCFGNDLFSEGYKAYAKD
ncbi:MAG: Fe-S-containing hydro-lyase [Nitrospinota bacterium]|nr:Fe-S-containing hydro-lyase [Nitrospinota bacterium]